MRTTDKNAMNEIQNAMDAVDWSPDTLETIAAIVRSTGRCIDCPIGERYGRETDSSAIDARDEETHQSGCVCMDCNPCDLPIAEND